MIAAILAAGGLAAGVIVSSGGSGHSTSSAASPAGSRRGHASPRRLVARLSSHHLRAPLSGEAIAPQAGGLLIVGGLDSGGVSTSSVQRLDSRTQALRPFARLAEPLHDAAAVTMVGRTLVFGGGSATTIDRVESLPAGGTGRVIGRLPASRSDLSSVTYGGRAYVLGGYDGATTVDSVLGTADGRRFAELARLPTPVRYAGVTSLGGTIYALGGELSDGSDSDQIQAVDIAGHRARVVAHLPQPVSHSSAVELGGRIYLLGGRRGGQASDLILSFDPSRRRVAVAGHLPQAVTNAAAATAGGAGYLVGGLDANGTALASIVSLRLGRPGSTP